jgi:hypothetical protein
MSTIIADNNPFAIAGLRVSNLSTLEFYMPQAYCLAS